MKSPVVICAFAVLLCAILPGTVGADNMRCGTHLVRSGDTKLEVLRHCGEPDLREVVSGADEPKTEQWYYERGSRQFPRVLTFRGFELIRIETITRR